MYPDGGTPQLGLEGLGACRCATPVRRSTVTGTTRCDARDEDILKYGQFINCFCTVGADGDGGGATGGDVDEPPAAARGAAEAAGQFGVPSV
jgi:hypothetical protein